MKRLQLFLFTGLMLVMSVVGQSHGMKKSIELMFKPKKIDDNQPQGTSARIKSTLGPNIPDALIDHVHKTIGPDAKVSPRNETVGSANENSPTTFSNNAAMHLDSQNGTIILDVPHKSLTTIVVDKETPGYRVEERTKLSDSMTHDQIKKLSDNPDVNCVISSKRYDATGKEIIASQAKISSLIQSLSSMQKSISDFFTRKQWGAAKIAAMPEGSNKVTAEKYLTKEAVDAVDLFDQLQPLEKQQLLQQTGQALKELFSKGKFNKKTFYAWCCYPHDRIAEMREARLGNKTVYSRNAQDGSLVIRRQAKGSEQTIDQIYEYRQNHKGESQLQFVKQDIMDLTGNVVEAKKLIQEDGGLPKIQVTKYLTNPDGRKVEKSAMYKDIDMNSDIDPTDTKNLESMETKTYSHDDSFVKNLIKDVYTTGKLNRRIETLYESKYKVRQTLEIQFDAAGNKSGMVITSYYDSYGKEPMMNVVLDGKGKVLSRNLYCKKDSDYFFKVSEQSGDGNTYAIEYGSSLGFKSSVKTNASMQAVLKATTKTGVEQEVNGMLSDILGDSPNYFTIVNLPEYKQFKTEIAQKILNFKNAQPDPTKITKLPVAFELELLTGLVKFVAENS